MSEALPGYRIHSFGCKVNTYDSGLLDRALGGQQMSGQVHILNTCAVTQEATKEAIRVVRRIRSRDPLATIVVTGCAAQVDTDLFENLPSVDLIVANSHKSKIPHILEQHFKGTLTERTFKSNIFRKDDLEGGGGEESHHSRAFLKIQDGCNSFCSYCIIPYARGKSRSLSVVDLTQRVSELVGKGYQEIVFTGVHIGDYEDRSDGKVRGLEDLIEEVLHKTSVKRLRLTSLEPVELTSRLLEIFQDERMCRHFHLSIQSASDAVLRAMKRNYGAKHVRSAFETIAKLYPDAYVGMDVIAGFPTETEEYFAETYQLLQETPWTRMHVFPYSDRRGTRSAALAENERVVSASEKQARARRLRELSAVRFQEHAEKQVGLTKQALILKSGSQSASEGFRRGLSRDYWDLEISTISVQPEQSVRVTGVGSKGQLIAEALVR